MGRLPANMGVREPNAEPTSAPPPLPSVLVVDDDRDVAMAVCDAVTDLGYRPISAGNGREALLVLEKERPALMFVDLFMPVMNGVEFLKIVKKTPRWAKIPRVIMTGINDAMISVKEDVPVLYKPLDLDSLAQLVRKHCEAAAGTGLAIPPQSTV